MIFVKIVISLLVSVYAAILLYGMVRNALDRLV